MTIGLPQELIEEILDHLAGDSGSLKACSLVCRAWVSRSRSHLFKTCTLVPDNILGFCELLRSPGGCTFIPHVCGIHADHHYWDLDDCRFNTITADLRRLTHVTALELAFYVRADHTRANPWYRSDFVTAFPHVTRVGISCDSGGPPAPVIDTICLFPALQELHIHHVAGSVAVPSATAVPPQGLHSLKLSANSPGPVLAWLHAFDRLPMVDSVALPVLQHQDAPIACAAFQQLGDSLRHLDITLTSILGDFDVDPLTVYDFSLHPNLITLIIRDFSPYVSNDSDPSRMMGLITRLAAPALESLSIDFDPTLWVFDWRALDAFLSRARFPHLQKVLFRCNDDQFQFLQVLLPQLEVSGVLGIMPFK
ncbi:hypothetical protein MVEN_00236000 [Mycena venus]|uniref:F-box domain-containing protein n=1 Tax=Mycena venus TaxID=2733690 RepID=A0A8H6Z185_9AGAR|nr:hypothetical protein MVEN_00236000 [Mycena venus]